MNQKAAITILLTVVILTVILMISLAAAGLVTAQLKMARLTGDSLKAFYAADAGAEEALYKTRRGNENDFTGSLVSGATYSVEIDSGEKKITSTGRFKNSNRTVEVYWE